MVSTLLQGDTDPDKKDVRNLQITGISDPMNGMVTMNHETGVISFTPREDYFGTAGFAYTLSDGRGGTDMCVVTVNVTEGPSDNPPLPPQQFDNMTGQTIGWQNWGSLEQPPGTHTDYYRGFRDMLVGDGVEVPYPNQWNFGYSIDVSGTRIAIDIISSSPDGSAWWNNMSSDGSGFLGLIFTDKYDVLTNIVGLNTITNNIEGLDGGRIWFDSGSVYIDFEGLPISNSHYLELGLVFA